MKHILSEIISLLAFGLVYGAAMTGLALQQRQPDSHRAEPTRQSVQLVMGLIATLAALVLSLLVASAHTYFETQQEEVQKLAADVILLDASLARYGPETKALREALRADVLAATRKTSPDEGVGSLDVSAKGIAGHKMDLFQEVLALEPKTNTQRFFQTKAAERMAQIGATRLTMHEQSTSSVPAALVIVLVLWLMLLFLGFGLYAPRNATVQAALGFGSFAVAGALFLILDMSHPYQGLIHVSDLPLRESLQVLGRPSDAARPQAEDQ